jgi:hypothetical protein
MRKVTTNALCGPEGAEDQEVIALRWQLGDSSPLDELIRQEPSGCCKRP